MKATQLILLSVMLLLTCLPLAAQPVDEESGDLVSMDATMRFSEAMSILQFYFVKYEGKIIVDLSGMKEAISIPINRIHWKAAFRSIMTAHQLRFDETVNAYVIYPMDEDGVGRASPGGSPEGGRVASLADEVLIEVTFFEADQNTLHEIGIDWSTLANGDVDFTANLSGASNVAADIFRLSFDQTFDTGSGTIALNTLLRTIEAHDRGHVISRPQITVISGEEGFVHDGMDFSIKTVDDNGNVSDTFFSAGTIVTVTPTVRTDASGLKYVQLDIDTERSSAEPGAVSTVVKISKARTQKILYNGEESIIGGLTSKEIQTVRRGLPFFKDLPWWVFGLRYLTGYDYHSVNTKELLIIMRATILPSMYERLDSQEGIRNEVDSIREQILRLDHELLEPTDIKPVDTE
ncbi:MAG: type II and III secretion system protein [Candidatus Cloacimonetes bacterium]|nr:type II and III secretion system protein [Candidatus Cloacimonadota bacterium]